MGMNTVGFMVVAPIEDVALTSEAIEQLRVRNLGYLEPVYAYWHDDVPPAVEDVEAFLREAEAAFDFKLDEMYEEHGGQWLEEGGLLALYRDPVKFEAYVRDLEKRFNEDLPEARDYVRRHLNVDGQPARVIFVGSATWGDEPDGVAYMLLKDILVKGLGELFSLR